MRTDIRPSAGARLARFVFGPTLAGQLPERVTRAVEHQQRQGEVLIGWIQLILVIAFGTLYALAPKTAMSAFHPVPWALGLYFGFTLARLAAAYRVALPAWVLMLSIIADIGLLMFLIWTFHIQYGQPASFYLKAPTMLYVFIFIALRALRFDPRYVLAAGAAAVAGWLVLMLYVVVADAENTMITRNYVEYLTSNSMLVGAEVDKLISIVFVTLVLAAAIHRASRLMRQAVADSMAARDLSRFISHEVAERITTAEKSIQPGDGESKVATCLFTDIEGFSTISERLSPEDLVRTLNDYFGAVSRVIERHGGVIVQFQGDAMLITYNTVTADPDHAANALRTAQGIIAVMAERTFGDDIAMRTRCGINTGAMTVGAVGSPDRLVFTVHGDEVNIAARLEQLNKQYGTYILASEQTRDAAGDGFGFRPMGDIVVRGRSQPTPVYAVEP